jgi:hypothetical protein
MSIVRTSIRVVSLLVLVLVFGRLSGIANATSFLPGGNLVSPGPIGAMTPSTGVFTTLSAEEIARVQTQKTYGAHGIYEAAWCSEGPSQITIFGVLAAMFGLVVLRRCTSGRARVSG